MFASFSRRARRASASVRKRSRRVHERSRRVRLGVAIGRYNSACRERVATCVYIDVSRGRRGELWERVRGAGSKDSVSYGRRREWWAIHT